MPQHVLPVELLLKQSPLPTMQQRHCCPDTLVAHVASIFEEPSTACAACDIAAGRNRPSELGLMPEVSLVEQKLMWIATMPTVPVPR